ncbi:hypothetical protein TorRG33x02_204460 [Trema orientale]|uniref:Uncharacterized protein n=1 Tax=Trema orientale TaxID=63057 RepID=A0A2P5EE14_TREOI|nr:hypothetical protein TorRG33x02_204460 [Trema orientale]
MPTEHAQDRDSSRLKNKVSRLRSMLENSKSAKHFLLFATVLGASLVIGDGILTPCISGVGSFVLPLFCHFLGSISATEFKSHPNLGLIGAYIRKKYHNWESQIRNG